MRPPRVAGVLRRPEVQLVLAVVASRVFLLFLGSVAVAASENPGEAEVAVDRRYVEIEVSRFRYADAEWYAGIVENGYEDREFSDDEKANWAFFPLWPLVWRTVWQVPPGPVYAALAVNTALFAVGVVLLFRLLALDFPRGTAFLTSLLVVVFPSAYFAFRPGPEAVFLATSVGSLLAARRRWWVLAGVLGALATLARPQGVLLLAPLAWIYYRRWRATRVHEPAAISMALIPAALLGFMLYLRSLTGNVLASFDIQRAWDGELSLPFRGLARWVTDPTIIDWYGFDLSIVSAPAAIGAVGLVAFMVVRPFPVEYTIYATLSVLLVLSRDYVFATMRYLLPVFPLVLALALLLRNRRTLATLAVCGFGALQAFLFVAYVYQFDWAHN
jgi:hypothetical protein